MLKYFIIITLYYPSLVIASTLINFDKTQPSLIDFKQQVNFITLGETTFSVFFWDIYKSRLSTTTGNYPIVNKNEKLMYEINYLADISKADLIRRTIEQWVHIGVDEKTYRAFIPQLTKIWPDIVAGDTLSLLIHNDKSEFYWNNRYIGDVNSPVFGKVFLDIWLSENTSQPELRTELLGDKYHDKH
jgi:hypothetical protein